VTNAQGEYRLRVVSGLAGPELCTRLFVARMGKETISFDVLNGRFKADPPFDSLRVDIVVP
jgi:hypothetical protein